MSAKSYYMYFLFCYIFVVLIVLLLSMYLLDPYECTIMQVNAQANHRKQHTHVHIGSHGRDRMEFITTCTISAYHN